jgi:hypothetical protein
VSQKLLLAIAQLHADISVLKIDASVPDAIKSAPRIAPAVPIARQPAERFVLPLDSLIVSAFPFFEHDDCSGTVAKLLWRGSRDGFSAAEFHRRCDGHSNTLTLNLGTDGNVFGGFTPVEWE